MKQILVFFALGFFAWPAFAQDVTVFAAASLTNALEEVGKAYKAQGGAVKFSFASSSTLAKQIEQGAPADIYISADEQWMDYLAQKRAIETDTRASKLGNTLVLIAPADSVQRIDIKPGFDLAGALKDGRLAVGDPAHVPAGKYAEQALRNLNVWSVAEPKLARADNVRTALALVERGEAPLGIVYGTDAEVSDKVKIVGVFPSGSHPAISYPFAITAGRNTPEVLRFFQFLSGPQARAVYQKYGFSYRP
jgi:molybdate transport system substrate-binding protein